MFGLFFRVFLLRGPIRKSGSWHSAAIVSPARLKVLDNATTTKIQSSEVSAFISFADSTSCNYLHLSESFYRFFYRRWAR
jgi:hypothetical protein